MADAERACVTAIPPRGVPAPGWAPSGGYPPGSIFFPSGPRHGTASDLFVLGAPVRGGFHGAQPSLADLDAGDLKYTTDFRDVYATLLARVLGADPGKILGGWKGRLDGVLG